MKLVTVRKIAALTIVTVTVWICITGCGGEKGYNPDRTPGATATTEAEQALIMLVPPDAGALFKVIATIAESGGQSYGIQIMESVSPEAGVRAILDGKIDLMLMMRQPEPDDPLVFLELFRTPVVIFVNSELGIDNLTREQAAALFSGEVTNWSQLGAPDIEIAVFVQEAEDTTTVALCDYLLGTTQFAESAQILFNDRDLISVVSGFPGSVSYSSLATKRLSEESTSGDLAKSVSLDGLLPDDLNYPLIAPVGFAFLPERQADLQPILDWAVGFLNSEMGQYLLEKYGARVAPSTRVEPEGRDNAHPG